MNSDRAYRLERRLVIIVLACLLLPALAVGWLGYSKAYDSIKNENIRNVGRVADARRDQLVTILQRTRARAAAFLADMHSSCSDGNGSVKIVCASEVLQSFTTGERALGAVLHLSGKGDNIIVGKPPAHDGSRILLQPGQLARFSVPVPGRDRSYDIIVEEQRYGVWLVITFPVSLIPCLSG
ncbi:MAG: hypothetical protein WCF85_18620 [Rhodospirillaceae bacterium]